MPPGTRLEDKPIEELSPVSRIPYPHFQEWPWHYRCVCMARIEYQIVAAGREGDVFANMRFWPLPPCIALSLKPAAFPLPASHSIFTVHENHPSIHTHARTASPPTSPGGSTSWSG